ncbi:MAG: Lrp/AsnC ligand binding domain-containing protein [Lentisphaeria bacterium]
MVTAFILINIEDKSYQKIVDELNALDGVTEVHLVAGEYDIVAVVKVENNDNLSRLLTDHITHIPGINHTKTLISLRS